MKRVDTPEILDSNACPPEEVEKSLRDLDRINLWFGGVATSRQLIERVAREIQCKSISLLEVAAGTGEVPKVAGQWLARQNLHLDYTLCDRDERHLPDNQRRVACDALALPFAPNSFDVVGCNLFAHHLAPENLQRFVREGLRVCRVAVLINDLVRHPLHLALVYAGFPLMRSRVSRLDGVASVRRAYVPDEMHKMLGTLPAQRIEIFRRHLFRMGVIVWKAGP